MHSSRMRTGCSLTICLSLLPGRGGDPKKIKNQNQKKIKKKFFFKKSKKKNFLKNQKKWGVTPP